MSSLSFRLFAFGRGTGRRSFFCGLCQFFHDRLTLRRVELIQLTFQHFGNLNRSFLTGFFNGCIQELTIRSRITSGKICLDFLDMRLHIIDLIHIFIGVEVLCKTVELAGLIQNYEVIRDSEVMMSKEANSIGKCPLCGSAVEDKAKAFFCSNRACKFALWKNNRYFASIGKSMTSATAQKLLGSGKVKLKNCKSERTGNTFDATVFMEVSDDGKTKFSMEFENGGKRK